MGTEELEFRTLRNLRVHHDLGAQKAPKTEPHGRKRQKFRACYPRERAYPAAGRGGDVEVFGLTASMIPFHQISIPSMWLAWLVFWWAMSSRVKATERRESVGSRLSYTVPLVLGFALLWSRNPDIPAADARFLPAEDWQIWGDAGAALTLAGLLFAAWARLHLGKNWSGVITIKEGHELVENGPYSVVRHPIYTGLLLAALGQAVAEGEWFRLVAVGIIFGAFWRKLRIEERWMRRQFGSAYETYTQRVSALIPFIL
jgi:protein-S-isoprenylcysteine O-methyltransferase Ste14